MSSSFNKKIKIMYIVSTLSRTGPTNQLFDVVKNVDLRKFEILIISLSREPANSRLDDFLQLGVKYKCLNYSRISWLLGRVGLKGEISFFCPDIIHSHGVRADIVSSMLDVKIARKISTVHNYPLADYRMSYGFLKGSLMAYLQLYAFRKMGCLVAVSKSVCDNLAIHHGFQRTCVEIINNGVDIATPSKDKELIRCELKIPCNSEALWLYAASFLVRKNHSLLLNAWEKMPENKHLLLLGDGPTLCDLKSKFSHCKNIHFLGQVSGVSNYLNCADYYISPSLAEGFPVAVLEALSLGKPTVLSKIAPHQELLDADFSCDGFGAVFENNIESLISAVNNAETKNYNSLSSNALGLISNKFNAMAMSRSYQALYNRLYDECRF